MPVKSIGENLQNCKSQRRCKGYTLVELIIVVSVIGVIASYAVPGFRGMIDLAQYNGAAETLAESLSIARNEAVFHGKEVMVCATDDPTATGAVCSVDQSNWDNGWIVFENCDSNLTRDSMCDLDGDGINESLEPIIKTFPATGATITNVSNTATPCTAASCTAVGFLASGFSHSIARFSVCTKSNSGTVTVSRLARIETRHIEPRDSNICPES